MTLAEISTLFLSGLYVIFFLWLVGHLVISFLGIGEWMNSLQRACSSLVVGLFVSVTVYSLLLSNKLNSISLVISILFALWIFIRKNSGAKTVSLHRALSSFRQGIDLKSMIVLATAYLLLFTAQLIKLDVFSGNIPTGSLDFPLYITIAEQLNSQGIENVLSYMNKIEGVAIFSAQPYHFFDLWFNALLQRATFSNHLYVYLFLFIPLIVLLGFAMMLFVGTWMLQHFPSTTKDLPLWVIASIAFALLFLVGYFPYHKIGHRGFDWLEAPIINNPKFFYSYLLLGLGVPLFFRKSYLNLAFLFLTVSYCYILYLPIVALCFFAITLLQWRELKSKSILKAVVFFVFGIGAFILFYYIQPQEGKFADVTEIKISAYFKNAITEFLSAKSMINFVRAYAVKVIYFTPFLILLIWQLKSGTKGLGKVFLLLLVTIIIGGFLSYAFSFHIEGWQFLAQLYGPCLYILFFLVLLNSLSERKSLLTKGLLGLVAAQLVLSIAITLGLATEYAPVVSRAFKDEINQNGSSFSMIGIYVTSHDSFAGSSRDVSPYLNYYTGFVKLVPNTWLLQASPMGNDSLDKLSPEFRSLYLNSPLIKFIKNRNISFEQGVRAFIKTNKIGYIVWSKQNDVAYLKDLIDRTITDGNSGFKISFLKQL